jgi:hypothetical protein
MSEQTVATKPQVLSPYKATTIVNEALAAAGLTDKDGNVKKLPPQMLYQYCNKGYIKADKVGGKWHITDEALNEWLVGYVAKQQELAAKRAAKLEAELNGTDEAEATEEPSPEELVEPAADEFADDETDEVDETDEA